MQLHMDSYKVAAQEFTGVLDRLRNLIENDMTSLEKDMESAGAPWTPGRIPTWQEQ